MMRAEPAALGPPRRRLDALLGRERPEPGSARLSLAAAAALVAVLASGFALRVGAELAFPRIHHPDEIFQYLEQAHRLAFGYGVVPWEYRQGGRSWLIPGMLAGLMKLVGAVGGGPRAYLLVIAMALSALSLSVPAVAFLWARRLAGTGAAILAGTVAATWFELVYFAPRPLSEVLATHVLVVGLYLAVTGERSTRGLVAAGALLAGAAVLRMQLVPAVVLALGVASAARRPGGRAALLSGAAAVVLLAGALDWITWGIPFGSFLTNLHSNVVAGRAASYGVAPPYQYLVLYVLEWGGAAVPIVALALAGGRRAALLPALALVVVLSHSAIPHKEYRFVYPALPFVLLAAALGTAELVERLGAGRTAAARGAALAAAALGWIALSGASAVTTRFAPFWTQGRGSIAAFEAARGLPSLCGIGIVGTPWVYTGGYTVLHRDVPMLVARDAEDAALLRDGFDAALTSPEQDLGALGFRRVRCYPGAIAGSLTFPGVCLQVRPGPCTADPARTLNPYLVSTGQ